MKTKLTFKKSDRKSDRILVEKTLYFYGEDQTESAVKLLSKIRRDLFLKHKARFVCDLDKCILARNDKFYFQYDIMPEIDI